MKEPVIENLELFVTSVNLSRKLSKYIKDRDVWFWWVKLKNHGKKWFVMENKSTEYECYPALLLDDCIRLLPDDIALTELYGYSLLQYKEDTS